MGVCHRDLKPENFMLVSKCDDLLDAQVKTIDFGLSKLCTYEKGKLQRMNTKVGTPYYISPDVLNGNYSMSCDIWSAGCILYIMLCGYPPFNGDSDEEILRNVQKGDLRFDEEEWSEISKEAKDLIKRMITKPEKRITAQEALQHKWFTKFTPDDQEDRKARLKAFKLDTFRNFLKCHKIQKATLTAIAVQASAEDITDLREIFVYLDRNGEGNLSFDQFKKGLGHLESDDIILRKIFDAADTDRNGFIEYHEFLAAALPSSLYLREDYLLCAFDMFDKDGSGKIDMIELGQILQGEEN
jgi:calcium-dependent protein kinase